MNARYVLLLFALNMRAEELPKLSDYPVKLTRMERYAKANIPEVREGSRSIRDLAYDRPAPPNFADRFTLFLTGCGSGCAEFCMIDRVSGRVFPGYLANGGPKLEFARDSRLVIIKHTDGMYGDSNPYFADCYVWEEDRFRFLGRWATTFGVAQNKKWVDWSRVILIAPNPRTWLVP
jgi:hypothetical protein